MSSFSQRSQAEEDALRAQNSQILYRLQASLTRVSLAGLSVSALTANSSEAPAASLSLLHQVLICGTYVLPRLCRFWERLRGELAKERPYQQASIGGLRLWLPELQAEDQEALGIREQGLKDGWEDIEGVLHREGFLYLPEIIRTEIIRRHHDDPLVGHFGIQKTWGLVAWKYYWPLVRHNVEEYVKASDVCPASKAIRHKLYGDLQLLPVPTHRWKNPSIDFVTGLPVSTNWKSETYDSILVIVDRLTKMVHWKPVKVTIDAYSLAEVIIDMVVRHHGLPDFIVSDRGSVFTSKFCSSLCYFLGIKRRLSTAFYPQTDGQTERHNRLIELYLRAFVNYE